MIVIENLIRINQTVILKFSTVPWLKIFSRL